MQKWNNAELTCIHRVDIQYRLQSTHQWQYHCNFCVCAVVMAKIDLFFKSIEFNFQQIKSIICIMKIFGFFILFYIILIRIHHSKFIICQFFIWKNKFGFNTCEIKWKHTNCQEHIAILRIRTCAEKFVYLATVVYKSFLDSAADR